jgi:ABC-type glycerol-3-phosphate transport system substrate-binding protein
MVHLGARGIWAVMIFSTSLLFLYPGGAQGVDWQAYKGTTIRVIQNKSSVGFAIESLLPEFEQRTGIKVQYETYTEDQHRQKVLLELSAGAGTLDAFATYAAQEGLKFWRSGWYEPLDPYLANARLTDPAFDLPDISRVAVQGNRYDGRLTSLPVQQNTTMLFYRKDLLEQVKLRVPRGNGEDHGEDRGQVANRGQVTPRSWVKRIAGNPCSQTPAQMGAGTCAEWRGVQVLEGKERSRWNVAVSDGLD